MEDEKYIKCKKCETPMGVYINDNQIMNIYCGICKERTTFEFILKEEFEVLIYKKDLEEDDRLQ